ncbi:MAG: zf-HC2 domain-containing protein [Deltaproteobacteria bacterium]|nr:zf-HC2 domain-containing protein [Deltaproteobacteria bacterium]
MLTCNSVRMELERFVDGELKERERLEIESHLLTCAGCEAQIEGILALREAYRDTVRAAVNEVSFDSLWSKVETEIDRPRSLTLWQRFVERIDLAYARFAPTLVPAAAIVGAVLLVWAFVGPQKQNGAIDNGAEVVKILKVDPGDFMAVEISPGDTKVVVFIDDPPGPPTVSGPH